MNITPVNLRALAEAAILTKDAAMQSDNGYDWSAHADADRQFHAAANPATILALLDKVDEVQDDYMRRHNDALDFMEKNIALLTDNERLQGEVERLRAENEALRSGAATVSETGSLWVSMPADAIFGDPGPDYDPRAEIRDPETGEVIFPAVKGPLRVIDGDHQEPHSVPGPANVRPPIPSEETP